MGISSAALVFILPLTVIGQQFEQMSVTPAQLGKTTFHSDAVAPVWLRNETFDLTAKFPEFATDPESYQAGLQAMMQKMLVEKFRLAVHKESRVLPIYAMSVEKSGIKFREATPGVEHTMLGRGSYSGSKISMAALAQYLTTVVGAPVSDSTGLTGVYDVTLSFQSVVALPVALSDGLGLRLDKREAPVEMLVVDHVEKLQ